MTEEKRLVKTQKNPKVMIRRKQELFNTAAIMNAIHGSSSLLIVPVWNLCSSSFLKSIDATDYSGIGTGWAIIFGGFGYFFPVFAVALIAVLFGLTSFIMQNCSLISYRLSPKYSNAKWVLSLNILMILYILTIFMIGFGDHLVIFQIMFIVLGLLSALFTRKKQPNE